MTWSVAERSRALDRMGHDAFDLVIVGGGITGAGALLDAAARGLRVALVERADFASGTSSRSSKLVHGGLRYLDQKEFVLVYEALAERQILLRNAPHLVEPQPFLFPLFTRGSGPARSQAARAYARTIGLALWLYDLTGGLRIGKRHRRVSIPRALELFPALDPSRVASAYLYYDARADDARLTLAIIQTAVHRFGAPAVNYTAAVGLEKSSGRISGVRVLDGVGGRELTIRAPVVLNAAGVWSDDVRTLDEGVHPGTIRPAKGVHITVHRSRLPVDAAVIVPAVPSKTWSMRFTGRPRLSILSRGAAMAKNATILGVMLGHATPAQAAGIHAALVEGLRNGTLRPVVGVEIPLKDAPRSHEAVMEAGHHGKVVLVP